MVCRTPCQIYVHITNGQRTKEIIGIERIYNTQILLLKVDIVQTNILQDKNNLI